MCVECLAYSFSLSELVCLLVFSVVRYGNGWQSHGTFMVNGIFEACVFCLWLLMLLNLLDSMNNKVLCRVFLIEAVKLGKTGKLRES